MSNILENLLAEINPKEQAKTDKRMLLAVLIKEGLQVKGWNNIQLANALHKKASVITKWLSGTHNFTSDTLFDIEEVLGINLIHTNKKPQVNTIIAFYSSAISKARIPADSYYNHHAGLKNNTSYTTQLN